MSLPVTTTPSGELATPGFLNSAVTWSPPSWPQALEVSTTAVIGPPITFWIVNVKSPRSPWKPRTSNVYVPAASAPG